MQVFLDTNIVLEGRPLADLPWAQLGASGPLMVYFLPKVLSEIDGKKRDGRLGEKARAFNRWISPLATSDTELLICDTPRVEARLANPRKIDWDALPDFDPSEADARVVAEMFNTPDLDPAQTVLVSQDINPLNMARRLGLGVHHVGSDWLAPKEATPADKEISRLKQKLREHEVSEPTLEIKIELGSTRSMWCASSASAKRRDTTTTGSWRELPPSPLPRPLWPRRHDRLQLRQPPQGVQQYGFAALHRGLRALSRSRPFSG